jgi:hypothetical protein
MWGLVIAAIGAGASVFNAADEATSNRAIREKLDKVIDYLKQLDQKLEAIQAQNREILRKLDELPRIIRAIVQEIVDDALLDERYATLHSIKLNIVTLKLDKKYRITEPGWRELSNALTYLFLHENRISYLFRLILACELALAATRNQAQPFIRQLLQDKIALMKALRDDFIVRITIELKALKDLLDNTQFIASHNLSENLDDFAKLVFSKQPDRLRTVSFTDRECVTRHGRCGEEWEVCRDVTKTRQEPDTPFHTARDNHVALIEQRKQTLVQMLNQLSALSGMIQRFEKYLGRVTGLGVPFDGVVLFHARTEPVGLALGARVLAELEVSANLSESEAAAYRYYYDDLPEVPATLDTRNSRELSLAKTSTGIFETVVFRCPD